MPIRSSRREKSPEGRHSRILKPGGSSFPFPSPGPCSRASSPRQVDNRSGLLASRWCPADSAYTELYLPGTEPTELCDQSGFRIRRPPGQH